MKQFLNKAKIALGFSKEYNEKYEIHKAAEGIVSGLNRSYSVEQQGKILRLAIRKMVNKRIQQIQENRAMLNEFKEGYEELRKL